MEAAQLYEKLVSFDICNSLKFKILGNIISVHPRVNTYLTAGGIRLAETRQINLETKVRRLSVVCNSLEMIVKNEFGARLVDVSDLSSNDYEFVMLYRDKMISVRYQSDFDEYRASVKESVTKDCHSADYRLIGSIATSRQLLKQDVDKLIDEFNKYKTEIKGDN